MSKLIYKTKRYGEAHDIMDWADRLGIEYEVHNAEETMAKPYSNYELGMTQEDWDLYQYNKAFELACWVVENQLYDEVENHE